MVASKKPQLQAATPQEFEENALVGDGAHDMLTDLLTNPDKPNRFFGLFIGRTTEAGGHDAGGARISKYGLEHIEVGITEKDEKDIRELLVRIHKRRTMQSEVKALAEPDEDTPLDIPADGDADAIPDVES